jgi:hypothetical protein
MPHKDTLGTIIAQAVYAEVCKGHNIGEKLYPCDPWQAGRDALKSLAPNAWLVHFPGGTVTVEHEALAQNALRNGNRVFPLYVGEEL